MTIFRTISVLKGTFILFSPYCVGLLLECFVANAAFQPRAEGAATST